VNEAPNLGEVLADNERLRRELATMQAQLHSVRESAAATRPPASATLAPAAEPRTVLIVDGEGPVREVIGDILRMHGYATLEAVDGDEAVALCERYARPIHLIITDLEVRGSSGPILVQRIATRRHEMKALFISGYTDDFVRQHGLLRVGGDFLQKPFALDDLVGKVREVLDARR
jgi:DNA-binding response OmpR family regulator